MIFNSFSVKLIFNRLKKVGRCWQVGSDEERPKGGVGFDTGNEEVGAILMPETIAALCGILFKKFEKSV